MFAESFIAPLQAALSPDEIATATTFFESSAGKKYVALNVIPIYSAIGAPSPGSKPIYSAQEQESVARFANTAVGAKLLRADFYNRAIKENSNSVILTLNNKCAN